jgi:hypothetical protein
MRTSPGPPETSRHARLRGKLATGEYGGRPLERWEIEVTGGGRIFYLLDWDKHTVRIEVAATGHPKVTDKLAATRAPPGRPARPPVGGTHDD